MAILDRLPQFIGGAEDRQDQPAAQRDGGASPVTTPVGAFVPALDLEETEDAYTLHVELAGVRPEDVEVSVDGVTLTIAGERHFYDEQDGERFRRIERRFGRFHRVVRLPAGSDPDGIEATHRGGLLEVHIPKREDARARRIAIQAA